MRQRAFKLKKCDFPTLSYGAVRAFFDRVHAADAGQMKQHEHRIYGMSFASVYAIYVAKAEKKRRRSVSIESFARPF